MSEDEEWTPPTEAEMKVLQAKRERSDKISKIMGDYLLKGYRMLATSCPICSNIELQDRSGNKYCVACQEVDCQETSKDNPAISQQAASRSIAEEAFSSLRSPNTNNNESASLQEIKSPSSAASQTNYQSDYDTGAHDPDLIPREPTGGNGVRSKVPNQRSLLTMSTSEASYHSPRSIRHSSGRISGNTSKMEESLRLILKKMDWANEQLNSTQSPEKATEFVKLIKECAVAVSKIEQLLGDN